MQPETVPELSLPPDLQSDLALIVLSILGRKGEGLPRDRAFWEKADRTLSRMRDLGLDRDTLRPSAGSTQPRSLSLSGS
jgi:hypothetical protein